MIGNYKNEPGKYLYGILDSLEQEVYETRLYPTIEEAVLFVRDRLITYYPEKDIKVYIYRKKTELYPVNTVVLTLPKYLNYSNIQISIYLIRLILF